MAIAIWFEKIQNGMYIAGKKLSDFCYTGKESHTIRIIQWKLLTLWCNVSCVLSSLCLCHVKRNIISAWIVHLWIVKHWILYHEIAKPMKKLLFLYSMQTSVLLIQNEIRKIFFLKILSSFIETSVVSLWYSGLSLKKTPHVWLLFAKTTFHC